MEESLTNNHPHYTDFDELRKSGVRSVQISYIEEDETQTNVLKSRNLPLDLAEKLVNKYPDIIHVTTKQIDDFLAEQRSNQYNL